MLIGNSNFIYTLEKCFQKFKIIILLICLIMIRFNISRFFLLLNDFDKSMNYTLYYNNLKITKEEYKIIGKNFLEKCKRNDSLINKKSINNPKISVIIPVFNCQNSIELSLKSVYYQNFNDLEIILINDLSTDNSSKIIERFQKIDQRIKIISNKRNMGTLYSRCIGALTSSGKYIYGLDNDDLFLFEDLFTTIYMTAEIGNYDIVEFKHFYIPNYNANLTDMSIGNYLNHKNNIILHQPELGLFSIKSNENNYDEVDHFVWAKSIKSSVYKKAVKSLGKKRYSFNNCWTEDISIVFVLFNIAKSFIFLNVFGLFHLESIITTTYNLKNEHKLINRVFFLEILFDYSKNDFNSKKYVIKCAEIFYREAKQSLTDGIKKYFKNVIKRIIKSKFISESDIILLQKMLNDL